VRAERVVAERVVADDKVFMSETDLPGDPITDPRSR